MSGLVSQEGNAQMTGNEMEILIGIELGSFSVSAAYKLSGMDQDPTPVLWPKGGRATNVPWRISGGKGDDDPLKFGFEATVDTECESLCALVAMGMVDSTHSDEDNLCKQMFDLLLHRRGAASHGLDLSNDAAARAEIATAQVTKFLVYVEDTIHGQILRTWPKVASTLKRQFLISFPPYLDQTQTTSFLELVEKAMAGYRTSRSFQLLEQYEASFSWYVAKNNRQLDFPYFPAGSTFVMCYFEAEVSDDNKYVFSPIGIEVVPIGALDLGESLRRELDDQLRTSTVPRMNEVPGHYIRNETKKAYNSFLWDEQQLTNVQLQAKFLGQDLDKCNPTKPYKIKPSPRFSVPARETLPAQTIESHIRLPPTILWSNIFDLLVSDLWTYIYHWTWGSKRTFVHFSGALAESPFLHTHPEDSLDKSYEFLKTNNECNSTSLGAASFPATSGSFQSAPLASRNIPRRIIAASFIQSALEHLSTIEIASVPIQRQSQGAFSVIQSLEMIVEERIGRQGYSSPDTMQSFKTLVSFLRSNGRIAAAVDQCKRFENGYTSEQAKRSIQEIFHMKRLQQNLFSKILGTTHNLKGEKKRLIDLGDLQLDGIHFATLSGHDAAVELLSHIPGKTDSRVASLACHDWDDGPTALHLAVVLENRNTANILLSHGNDVNAQCSPRPRGSFSDRKWSCVHLACLQISLDMVSWLLESEANVNLRTHFDLPPIIALSFGYLVDPRYNMNYDAMHRVIKSITPLLIGAGSDVNAVAASFEYNHSTALHRAAYLGSVDVATSLIDAGADLYCVEGSGIRQGFTPLHCAARAGRLEMVNLLLSRGVFVDHLVRVPYSGFIEGTVLHTTAVTEVYGKLWIHRLKTLKYLVEEAGASITRKAIHRAKKGSNDETHTLISLAMKYWESPDPKWIGWCRARTLKEGIEKNDILAVQHALAAGADPNMEWDGATALILSLVNTAGSDEVAWELVNAGADVNMNNGKSPLPVAAAWSTPRIVSLLLDKGSDVNALRQVKDYHLCALQCAAQQGEFENAKILVERGANVNLRSGGQPNVTPLHVAVVGNHREVAQLLIDNHADVNAICSLVEHTWTDDVPGLADMTPLHLAVVYADEAMVEFLLNAKSNVQAVAHEVDTPTKRYTALELAERLGLKDFAELIRSQATGIQQVSDAIMDGDQSKLEEYLDAGFGVNTVIENDGKALFPLARTPLWLALCNKQLDIAKLLIRRGADVNRKWLSTTMLCHTIHKCEPDFARMLLENKADINATFICRGFLCMLSNTQTALHCAVEGQNSDMVHELLALGADSRATIHNRDHPEYDQFTPLHLATRLARADALILVQALLDAGVEVDMKIHSSEYFGATPLCVALLSDNPTAIVKLLVERGAQNVEFNHRGIWLTPLHLAAERGYVDVLEFLLSRGWEVDVLSKGRDTPSKPSKPLWEPLRDWNTPLTQVLRSTDRQAVESLPKAIEILLHHRADMMASVRIPKEGLRELKYPLEIAIDIQRSSNPAHPSIEKAIELLRLPSFLAGIRWRNTRLCILALDAGLEPNSLHNGISLLLHAISQSAAMSAHEFSTLAAVLINKGADVNACSTSETPLYFASCRGNIALLKCLLRAGAAVNAKTKSDHTPLFGAIYHGHETVAKLLVEQGAELHSAMKEVKKSDHWGYLAKTCLSWFPAEDERDVFFEAQSTLYPTDEILQA